jgi:phage shock protein E
MKLAYILFALATLLTQSAADPFTQDTLKSYLENGAPINFILIDVRSSMEISAAIGNSSCKPYNLAWPEQFQEESKKIPKDQTIIIYCKSGRRAKMAVEYLKANGFTNVLDAGGFNTWTGPTVVPTEIKPASLLPEPSMRKKP